MKRHRSPQRQTSRTPSAIFTKAQTTPRHPLPRPYSPADPFSPLEKSRSRSRSTSSTTGHHYPTLHPWLVRRSTNTLMGASSRSRLGRGRTSRRMMMLLRSVRGIRVDGRVRGDRRRRCSGRYSIVGLAHLLQIATVPRRHTHIHIPSPPHNTTAGPDTSAFDHYLQVHQTYITHKPLPPRRLINPNHLRRATSHSPAPTPQPLPPFPQSSND